jgi:PadR family transcriptional regulator, regulatory protein PadR
MTCCDMKGYLTFLVLHLIGKQDRTGEEIRQEIEKRKGSKPSPGTIYPVLKSLSEKGLIEEIDEGGREKRYRITKAGKKELDIAVEKFMALFCDLRMR